MSKEMKAGDFGTRRHIVDLRDRIAALEVLAELIERAQNEGADAERQRKVGAVKDWRHHGLITPADADDILSKITVATKYDCPVCGSASFNKVWHLFAHIRRTVNAPTFESGYQPTWSDFAHFMGNEVTLNIEQAALFYRFSTEKKLFDIVKDAKASTYGRSSVQGIVDIYFEGLARR